MNSYPRSRNKATLPPTRDSCGFPSRWDFESQLSSIHNIDGKIHDLLSFLKNKESHTTPIPKHTTSIYYQAPTAHDKQAKSKEPVKASTSQKKHQYKKQKTENHTIYQQPTKSEISEDMRVLRQIHAQYESDRIQKTSQAAHHNDYPLMEKTNYQQSVRATLPHRRSKSPALIKPLSKYIRCNQDRKPVITKDSTRRSPSMPQSRSPSLPQRKSPSPIQRIKTSTEVSEYLARIPAHISSFNAEFDSKHISEERQSLQESHLVLQKEEDPLTPLQNLKNTNLMSPTRERISPDYRQDQPASPYQASDFELKLYPCDLNEDSLKTFIADKLAQMVAIDIELDSLRDQYSRHQDKHKRKKLTKVVWERGWMISEDEAERYLGIQNACSEGPVTQQVEVLVEALVDKFLEGEYFWDKKLSRILSEDQLQNAHFKVSKLDLEKRGYLKIEDLTCFINLFSSSSSSFKNRNVSTLFKRFLRAVQEPADRLPYEVFADKICRG